MLGTTVPGSSVQQCCEACRRFMVVRNSRGQLICEGCLHEQWDWQDDVRNRVLQKECETDG